MSIRVDTTSLIPGAIVCGSRGLGVLGSVIRANTAAGAAGPGLLYADWDGAADDSVEIRMLIERWPVNGILALGEDGAGSYSGGADYAIARVFADGVDKGTKVISFFGGAPGSGSVSLSGLGGYAAPVGFGLPTVSAQGEAAVVQLTGLGGLASVSAFGLPHILATPEGGSIVTTPAGRILKVAQDGVHPGGMLQPLPFSPGAKLDVVWDWSGWLEAGESIISKDVLPADGLTLRSQSLPSPSSVLAWLELAESAAIGAQLGAKCRIVTSLGRVELREVRLVAMQR
ncbi:hypothetical protein LNV23_18880 [Paucibacter sp. DJ1R-11]|uniref:phage fiber-tail adaptor protein n=1 Tax=Paucibacter sp. DJ1R-11 TaxID=2893556 RepID=UPI0021E431C9|nr:hypothetical protein [Paucibacter sp. DJ1R-11]MCV2365518.1 hypothetical protein [Paucibacter sp. DJ1R-11]